MDERAPSPFASPGAPRAAYPNPAYAPNYGSVPAEGGAFPAATPTEVDVREAMTLHNRGAWIFTLAWICIGLAIALMIFSLGLLANNLSSGGAAISGGVQDLFVAAVGLLAAGISARGFAFTLMYKADFLIRARAWLAPKAP